MILRAKEKNVGVGNMTKFARYFATISLGIIFAHALFHYGGIGFLLAATILCFMIVLST